MENKEFLIDLLNKTFFAAWKNQNYKTNENLYANFASLELQITSACDQRCSYCYYHKHGDVLNPSTITKRDNILNNLEALLSWLSRNSYFPRIEIFSGEPFAVEIGFKVVERVIDWYIENNLSSVLTIPTNFSFIMNSKRVRRMEELLAKARSNGIDMFLSASVDGKYLDERNRPFVNKRRSANYYDKIFEFAKKWGVAFHPMIYKDGIELWKDNFLWFQTMFTNYELPWHSLYLLEVRNYEWDLASIREFYKFIYFVTQWSIKKLGSLGVKEEDLLKAIHQLKLFNLFSGFFTTGRGIGCSVQSTMQLRLGDLSVHPCHRTAYPQFKLFQFIIEDSEIVGIRPFNYGLFPVIYGANSEEFPFCEACSIRKLCSGTCLGANYEYSGELFLPPPTVCLLEHAKVYAIIDALTDLDVLKYFYGLESYNSIFVYRKYIKE